jgi:hypothetical protein
MGIAAASSVTLSLVGEGYHARGSVKVYVSDHTLKIDA